MIVFCLPLLASTLARLGRACSVGSIVFFHLFRATKRGESTDKEEYICKYIAIRYLSIQNTGTVAEVSINPKETIFQPMFLMKFSLSGLILLEYSLTMLKNPAFSRGRPHGGGPEQTRPKNERSGPDQDPTRTRPGPDQRREITRPA